MIRYLVFLYLSMWMIVPAQATESAKGPHVRVSWLAPKVFEQNRSETIGLYFEIDPEWHVYWKNSGDSGAPPKFNFQDGNYEVGRVQWPTPKRISTAHLTNIGYEKATAFLFSLTPKGLDNQLKLSMKLEWLVCKVECIPGIADISLTRPIHAQASIWDLTKQSLLNSFQKKVPSDGKSSPFLISLVNKTDNQLVVDVSGKTDTPTTGLDIFPVDGELVNPQAPKIESLATSVRYTFSLPPGGLINESVTFLLVNDTGSWEQPVIGLGSISPDTSEASNSAEKMNLLGLLFFAFLGGIILNLMPCVLPVLSIKFLSVIKTSAETRRADALLYLAGVLVTFFCLGGVFLLLRSAGSAIGWGFQLQSPTIVLLLILLFWLISLNFLGFLEFGESITNLSGRFGNAGAFSTGILAVFVAAPCTGPFMGTALGAAAVLPTFSALGIFLSLGFGLAFPFVLVSFVPSIYKKMPKPGAWMEKLKQFLAFPLLGTVVWLTWVLGIQLGSDGWLLTAALLLALVFSIWIGKSFSKKWTIFAYLLAVFAISFGVFSIKKIQQSSLGKEPALSDKSSTWIPFDQGLIALARAKGQSVFVDFTAAWCITCQVNKKTVLDTEYIQNLFKQNDVLIVRADWTNQDPVITQALAEFDRNSVPVYLFYDKGADAVILPQVLTTSVIENLFNKKE